MSVAQSLLVKGESTPLVSKLPTWQSVVFSLHGLQVALMSSMYVGLNIGLNFYNKHVLGNEPGQLGLDIPVFYTLCHQITGFIVYGTLILSMPSLRVYPVSKAWSRYWQWLLALGFFFSTSIVTNNMSFGTISLTVNSILKSIMPAPTVVCAYYIQGYRPSYEVILSLAIITLGAVLACLSGDENSHDSTWQGYLFIAYSLVTTTLRPVIAGRIFESAKADGEAASISVVTLSFFDAVMSIVILFPSALIMEMDQSKGLFHAGSGSTWGSIALGSAMAGGLNYSAFTVVNMTSSVTFVVLGQFKQIFLIVGASLAEGYGSAIMWVGSTLMLAGGMWYAFLKGRESRPQSTVAKPDAETGPK